MAYFTERPPTGMERPIPRASGLPIRSTKVMYDIAAVDSDGTDLPSHRALWFAWSQFHPETALWPR